MDKKTQHSTKALKGNKTDDEFEDTWSKRIDKKRNAGRGMGVNLWADEADYEQALVKKAAKKDIAAGRVTTMAKNKWADEKRKAGVKD